MRSGTTPKIEITLDIPLTTIKEIWVTFATVIGTELLTKKKADCVIGTDKITVPLTQDETLQLNPSSATDNKVLIQVRVLTNDNQAFASAIDEIRVERILKEGVISSDD
ncbi:MAG: hypothetical protein Q4C64_02335 [Erysipelotrichia bacterium]|nr:hypothetical protein [Erysipelotrichia bacterium]